MMKNIMKLKVYSIEKIRELIELSLQGTPHPSLRDTFSSRRRLWGEQEVINPSTASGPPPLKGRQFCPCDLIIGGRCHGKVLHQLRMIEEAEKHGTVKVVRANEHYLDAFRYALMDKPGINPLYPVESESDVGYEEWIKNKVMGDSANKLRKMKYAETSAGANPRPTEPSPWIIDKIIERMKSPTVNRPLEEQVFFWFNDEQAKRMSETTYGLHISSSTNRRFRNGEIINDRKD